MINKIISKEIVSYAKFSFRSFFYSVSRFRKMSDRINYSVNVDSRCMDDYARDIKAIIPKLTENFHKGQCGRIGVVGGSLEYTGAPYFAAMSALKLGADLVYVICSRDAAPAIKSYSPELIVYPVLDDAQAIQKISPCLEKLHSLVIGPGLGRDLDVFKNVEDIISYCNSTLKRSMPLIIDADGLFLITQKPNLIKDYKGPVILTPNVMEYSRLCQKLSVNECDFTKVAETLNCVLLMKGEMDVICNGIEQEILKLSQVTNTITCNVTGSVRRCGGQGDVLSGCIAVFVAWFIFKRYNGAIDSNSDFFISDKCNIKIAESSVREGLYKDRFHGFNLACYAACCITRHCSYLGFQKQGRSMITSEMISYIHASFVHFYDE